jgi:hypothetical protein
MARRTITSVSVSGMAREKLNDNFGELYSIVGSAPVSITVAIAKSTTTDGVEATFTVLNSAGNAVSGIHTLDVWVSDDADGSGLTATAASGALTAATGTILTALTAKKHVLANTSATGVLKLLLVDSANSAAQRFCCTNPTTGKIVVSAATTAASYEGGGA